MVALCKPAAVHWCDGSAEEYEQLCNQLVNSGAFRRLNPAKRPNSFYAASDPRDVARVESRIKAGGVLRSDDTPETLKHRLEVYYKNTAPLIGFYKAQGKLKTLDGMAAIPEVTRQIDAALDGVAAKA